jgi:probable phosphoglycerate mutase
VVLIRHGQAVCNVEGIVGGPKGCHGLTDLGRRQATALAERLVSTGELRQAVALYSSVLPRAVETAALVRRAVGPPDSPPEPQEQDDLSELHPGGADGMTWAEVIDTFGVPDWDVDQTIPIAPDGESWATFVPRASGAVRAIAERHPGTQVVLAVHAGVIEATMIAFLGITPEASRRGWLRIQHASLTEWEWVPTQARWVLLRFNDVYGIPQN